MPKFAANLTMLFTEAPFQGRFALAAKAGFKAVEFLFPYPYPVAELKQRLQANGLSLVLHNLPAGDWEKGDRGNACLPGREGEFREGVAKAIEYGTALGVKQINCLAGKGTDRAVLVKNLRYAASELKGAGIKLLMEPINTYDIPGFFLTGTKQAVEIIDEVGSDNLFIQYDAYHMQRMEGELCGTVQKLLPRIAHVQVADNPGRGEPGTGEVNWEFFFAHLDRIGYTGHVGCEYKPKTTTEAGLSWLKGRLK